MDTLKNIKQFVASFVASHKKLTFGTNLLDEGTDL